MPQTLQKITRLHYCLGGTRPKLGLSRTLFSEEEEKKGRRPLSDVVNCVSTQFFFILVKERKRDRIGYSTPIQNQDRRTVDLELEEASLLGGALYL